MRKPVHTPPLSPTVLHHPVILLPTLHKPSDLHPVVKLTAAILKHALPVEEEVDVDGNGHRHWPPLHHTRQTFAVVQAVTGVRVAPNAELPSPLQTRPRLPGKLSQVAMRVVGFESDPLEHGKGKGKGHPPSSAAFISEWLGAVDDLLLRKVHLSAPQEKGRLYVSYCRKGIARTTESLVFYWRNHAPRSPVDPPLSPKGQVSSEPTSAGLRGVRECDQWRGACGGCQEE